MPEGYCPYRAAASGPIPDRAARSSRRLASRSASPQPTTEGKVCPHPRGQEEQEGHQGSPPAPILPRIYLLPTPGRTPRTPILESARGRRRAQKLASLWAKWCESAAPGSLTRQRSVPDCCQLLRGSHFADVRLSRFKDGRPSSRTPSDGRTSGASAHAQCPLTAIVAGTKTRNRPQRKISDPMGTPRISPASPGQGTCPNRRGQIIPIYLRRSKVPSALTRLRRLWNNVRRTSAICH